MTPFGRFQDAMRRVVQVPRAKIQERVEGHRRKAAHNPKKRGPKPKPKPSAYPYPDA